MYVKDWFDPTDVVPEDCETCDGSGSLNKKYPDNGKVEQLAAADMCIRCQTFLDGRHECPTCKLVYGGYNE